MDILKGKRVSYIEASDMTRVNYVADVLLHDGVITKGELECIQSIRGTRDRARAVIDCARNKGNVASKKLMDAWDNYRVFCGSSAAPELSEDILETLDELSPNDVEQLKWSMRTTRVYGRQPIARSVLDRLTLRTQIADAIVRHYADKARAVLLILLEDIRRNDLVENIRSGARDRTSDQRGAVTLAAFRDAIQGNAAEVRCKVRCTLQDLGKESFTRFVWNLHLPSNKSECITGVSSLVDVLIEHVDHDTFAYVETVYATLCKTNRNDLAQMLAGYIRGLSA